ncbi:hypothetical protein [Streptomyces mutabilis]|uniref:hypothetical protein n=1 Tax=Streptomyces TaxID=1883 RepID=UPI003986F77C
MDQVKTGRFQIKLKGDVIGRPAIEDKSLLPKPIHNTATREAETYWVLEVVAQ